MAKKILAFCAALVALAVVPAGASASPEITFPTGTRLATPTSIQATNVGPTIMTPGVECSEAFMTGTLIKNNGTEIEGEITTAKFNNTGSTTCTATFGNVTVTPNTGTNGLPWCIKAGGKLAPDAFQLTGGKCGATPRPIRFALDLAFGGPCVYERSGAVSGTFKTHPEDALLTISEQAFPGVSTPFPCPGEGKLDMTFTLETDPGGSPLYIS